MVLSFTELGKMVGGTERRRQQKKNLCFIRMKLRMPGSYPAGDVE